MAAFATALRAHFDELKVHIRAEERNALPLARAVLTGEDWAEIDRAFLDANNPVFGGRAKAELRELFHRIAKLARESVGLGGHSAGQLPVAAATSPAAEVLLRVGEVESCYGRIRALTGISVEVRRGETFGGEDSSWAGTKVSPEKRTLITDQ